MIFSNKTKNTFLKTSWIFIFFLGSFQINAQTSFDEQVPYIPFETTVEFDTKEEGFDFNDGMGAPVVSLSASTLPEGKVNISWKYNLSPSLQDFILYKKQDGKNWEVYKNINAEDACQSKKQEGTMQSFSFDDLDNQNGSKVEYRIVARYVNGVKTEVSESIEFVF